LAAWLRPDPLAELAELPKPIAGFQRAASRQGCGGEETAGMKNGKDRGREVGAGEEGKVNRGRILT